jgi:hypothetical protein
MEEFPMAVIIETDENGALTIPAELLEDRSAHTRYVVEKNGCAIRIAPVTFRSPASQGHEDRMRRWRELAERIDRSSVTDRSAVEILSEMRR